uniref:acetylcholine receptor subunit beta-like n=1 Tax=Styela clava TaxID=7725 RepID=UPI00193A0134|nr:acetylcholine receptor subunit beta-like [Styela clava]
MKLNFRHILLFAAFVLLFQYGNAFKEFQSDEAKLARKLLADYNPEIRPYGMRENATKVRLGMTLSQIISVNEKDEELSTSVYMTHEWNDFRLTWNKSDFGGIHIHRLPADDIWTPRIILGNSKDGEFDVSLRVDTLIHSDGSVEWLPPALYKSSCSIEVALFPFDWQNCTMDFRLTTYDKSEIELEFAYGDEIWVDPAAFQPNGEWDLIQKPIKIHSSYRDGAEFQTMRFYFIMQRRPQFYVMNLIVPCILMTLISCFVFFLPSVSCEKMTLSISVLLGETVFLFLIAQRMPETSLSVPLIAGYLLFTMTLVICCVIFSVIVCNIHYRSSRTHLMPKWVKTFFMDFLAPILYVERPPQAQDAVKKPTRNSRTEKHVKDILDRNVLQAPSEVLFDKQARRYGFKARHVQNATGFIDVNSTPDGKVDVSSIPAAMTPLPYHLQCLVTNIKYVSSSIQKDQFEEQACDDWAYVALVVDRLLFWIYLGVFTFGTLGFFLKTTTAYYPT